MTQRFSWGNPKGRNLFFLWMKGKLQLLFTFLFYLSYNPDDADTSVSSAPTKWKLQLPYAQASTCTKDFYSLPLLLPTNLESLSITKNLQTNSLSSLTKIQHSNPLCLYNHIRIHSWPNHIDLSICAYVFSPWSLLYLHHFFSLSLYNFISFYLHLQKWILLLELRLYH